LQRRPFEGCQAAVPPRGCHGQAVLIAGSGEGDLAGRATLRRQRLHQGIPGGEVLARLQGGADLRGDVEHAAGHDRQIDYFGAAVGTSTTASSIPSASISLRISSPAFPVSITAT